MKRNSSRLYKNVVYSKKNSDTFAVPAPGNIGKANCYVKLKYTL